MPDTVPPFDPRPGDYDAMLGRAARRRRVRRVRALAAAAPVLTLAVALAALPGGNAASLRPANDGTTVAGESPDPTRQPTPPADQDPAPTGDPTADPTPDPTPDRTPDASADPEPDPTGDPAEPAPSEPAGTVPPPAERPSESPRPSPRPSSDAIAKYAYLTGQAPAGCRTEGGAQSAPDTANWCASYAGATSVDAGSVVSLPFRLCRSGSSVVAGRLTRYETSSTWMKARVVAADGSVPRHWRRAEQPAEPAIDVQPGDCVQWTVEWHVTTEPGEYRLNPVFIVREYAVTADANHFAVTVRG